MKAPPLAGRTVVPLPAEVSRVLPAGGGRFLVLHFPTRKQVGLFDVTEAKIVRTNASGNGNYRADASGIHLDTCERAYLGGNVTDSIRSSLS